MENKSSDCQSDEEVEGCERQDELDSNRQSDREQEGG